MLLYVSVLVLIASLLTHTAACDTGGIVIMSSLQIKTLRIWEMKEELSSCPVYRLKHWGFERWSSLLKAAPLVIGKSRNWLQISFPDMTRLLASQWHQALHSQICIYIEKLFHCLVKVSYGTLSPCGFLHIIYEIK
jgi:hypothetical protein